MLKLTKKADYGLIAIKHLSLGNDGLGWGVSASAKEIAEAYRIPQPLLAKVLQKLAKSGFLESVQGTNGGYRLARDPKKISALQVIRSIDGPILLTSCFTDHRECDQSELCTVREPLRKVHEGILKLLDGITVASMSETEEEEPSAEPPGSGARLRVLSN